MPYLATDSPSHRQENRISMIRICQWFVVVSILFLCYYVCMETPTIVKRTKKYLLVKIPLREQDAVVVPSKKGKMTHAEKRLWDIIQEGEKDLREGKIITAKSIDEALRKYEKRQWG